MKRILQRLYETFRALAFLLAVGFDIAWWKEVPWWGLLIFWVPYVSLIIFRIWIHWLLHGNFTEESIRDYL